MAYYSPGPKTAAPPFERCDDLWTTISRHPGSRPVTSVSLRSVPTHRVSFHSTRLPTLSRRSPRRARPPFTRTATLLGALRAWVFGTRHRLTTSATACRRTGNQTSGSLLLAGTRTVILFLFFRITPSSCEAVTRGKPRLRPFDPTPVPVLPGCPGLPDRDTESIALPRSAFDRDEFSSV